MISFNGTNLEDVADVKIDDIRVSPITLNPVTRQRPIQWGQEFVRTVGQARTVVITFALLKMNRDERFSLLTDITKWALVGEVRNLSLPMMEGWHLEATCTGLPEPSYRMWWESKLRLTFTTMDNPYWTNDNENTAALGRDINIGGNAPPLMRIERTIPSQIANQSYSNGSESMLFTQIPAGQLVIDCNRQLSAVSGTSIDRYLSPTSTYIIPRTGVQNIKGVGTIYYRERCL